MKHKSETFWTRVNRFSPILCRLLARHPYGPPLTEAEIAQRSGLAPYQILTLSALPSWHGVDLFTMKRFTEACGLDFTSSKTCKRIEVYLKGRPTFKYLRRSPHWDSFYRPMIERWRESIARSKV